MNTTTSTKTRKSPNKITKSPKFHNKAKKYQSIDEPYKGASQYKGEFEIRKYDGDAIFAEERSEKIQTEIIPERSLAIKNHTNPDIYYVHVLQPIVRKVY